MLSRVLAVTAFVLLAPLLAAQQPAPKPVEVPPQLDKSKPPENRPQKAPEREKIDPKKYSRPTLEKHLADVMEPWVKALQPAVVPGNPKAMAGAQTNKEWWSKTATLKYETVAGAGGKKLAEGWATATWNTTGKPFAEGTFRQDKMHGVWHFYNDKGELESVRAYANGICEGPYVTVNASGVTSYGIYKSGNRHAEWLHFDKTGFLHLRVMWGPAKTATETKWQREYNARGELTRYFMYRGEDRYQDVVVWLEPRYDDKGKLANPSEVGRCELQSRNPSGKLHGWQTFYDAKGGYRRTDTWYEEGEQTGPFLSYNAAGKKIQGGTRRKGVVTGAHWHVNSISGVRVDETYDGETGLRHGEYKETSADGEVITSGSYEQGKAIGPWTMREGAHALDSVDLVDESFELRKTLKAAGNYKDGFRDGPWTWHRADGTLGVEAVYANRALNGAVTVYGPDGKTTLATGKFVNGLKSGHWTFLYADGARKRHGEFSAGVRIGTWLGWHPNGNKESEGLCLNGLESGLWVYYWPNGKLRQRGTYARDTSEFPGFSQLKLAGEWDSFDEQGELIRRDAYTSAPPYVLQGHMQREAKLENPPEGVVLNPALFNGTIATWRGDLAPVLVSRVVAVNGKPHGKIQQYHPNGKLGAEGDAFGDKREGLWKYWYDTGIQKEEATFFDGNPKGPYKSWRPDGTLEHEGEYTGQTKTGRWLTYHLNGKQVQRDVTYDGVGKLDGPMVEYFLAGQVQRRGTYAGGRETGPWETFFPDGKPRFLVHYREGRLDGSYKAWHANGQLAEEKNFAAGKLDGAYQAWHDNGQFKSEGSYKEGKAVGVWKEWFTSGKPLSQKEFDEQGKPKGQWTEWNEDGSVKSETSHG